MKVVGKNDKGPRKNPQIDIKQSKSIVCVHCSGSIFIPAMKFQKISKILTGTPKDAIIPIEVFCCADCGQINKELLPDELKDLV